MDWTGEHRDAVPADLVAEVLAGDADGTRAGRAGEEGWGEVTGGRGGYGSGLEHLRPSKLTSHQCNRAGKWQEN